MSEAAVTLAGESELRLSGVLDYQTGPRLRKEGQALIKKALAAQLPGIPLAGGDDFGSVTAGLARWAQVVFR